MSLTKYFKCFNVFIFAISFAFADFIETGCDLPENSIWADGNLILYNVDTDIQSFSFTLVGATASSGQNGDMIMISPSFCYIVSDQSTGEVTGECYLEGVLGINPDGCGVLTELQDLVGTITDITDITFTIANSLGGGDLPVTYCSDCVAAPDCGGAPYDCAGQCNGNAVEDCLGVCDGSAVEDCAEVCDGGAVDDCFGVCEGSAVVDVCGVCDGEGLSFPDYCCSDTGLSPDGEGPDCNGVCGGGDVVDPYGTCCDIDGGGEELDECGVCETSGSGIWNQDMDCLGVCFGNAELDICGVCDGEGWGPDYCCLDGLGPNGEEPDCDGVCGGGAVVDVNGTCCEITAGMELDECGVCEGDDTACADCAGVPNGSSEFDVCGVCDGPGLTDNTGCCWTNNNGYPDGTGPNGEEQDCDGNCGGAAVIDVNGICCELDDGFELDSCGVCDGGEYDLDCLGVCFGDAIEDCTGECGGSGILIPYDIDQYAITIFGPSLMIDQY